VEALIMDMSMSFSKSDKDVIVFEGVNTFLPPGFDIAPGELTYARNLDCHKSPSVLSVRPGRATFAIALTTPNAAGVRDNAYLHVQDGTVWKRWDGTAWQNVATGLTSATGKIFDFMTADKALTVLLNGTDKKYWDGTTVTDMTAAPASKLCVGHRYRLYFADVNAVKASDLSDLTTYPANCILPVTKAKGPLLAIDSFLDHVITFSERSYHKLYGIEPYDWEFVDGDIGCIADRSLIKANNFLWWLGPEGTAYQYGGGTPKKVSDKIANEYMKNINYAYKHLCCSGTIGNSIFWSIPHGSSTTNNLILEYRYDFDPGRWYIHTGSIVQFVRIGDNLYGTAANGTIYNMASGTDDAGTAIPWNGITKPFHDMSIVAKKTVKQMYLVISLPVGSTFTLSGTKTEVGTLFDTIKDLTASASMLDTQILVPTNLLQLANWYRLKFEGTGPCDIYYLYKEVGKRGDF
jgi:hypothetical protein